MYIGKAVIVNRPGCARQRWAVDSPFGYIGHAFSAKDAERKVRPLFKWLRRRNWKS